MANDCTMPIIRGINRGKICKDVNKICRHQQITCPNCDELFSYKHTYVSHLKICRCAKKIRIDVTKKQTSQDEILSRLYLLEKQNQDLRDKVDKVAQQPRNNIVVIGNDFYQELTAKIGKDKALEFLSTAATLGKPISVIDKLYLEGKDPTSYPIACREGHFRYFSTDYDGSHKLVDDQGGVIIGDIITDRLRSAFLMAANEMISQCDSGKSESNADILKSIQNITTIDKNTIVYQLAKATNITNHPFFMN